MRRLERGGVICLLLSILLISQSNCCFAEEPSGIPVYIFRGAAGYWPGVKQMASRVQEEGFDPVVCRCSEMFRIKSQIVKQQRAGIPGVPVLIIGYSAGAETAVKLTQGLEKEGIRVDGLWLIEAYKFPSIPSNVDYCFNLFESRPSDRWFIFRGTPVSQVTSNTSLLEIDVAKDERFAQEFGGHNHFTIQDDDRIQKLIARQLQSIPFDDVR